MPSLRSFTLFFLCLGMTFQAGVWGITQKEVFMKYPNKYFIETGCYLGDGIQRAIDTGSFENIYSIELSPKYYQICLNRFKNHSNVKIWFGDSATMLKEVIATIKEPATFWLDGHCSMGDTAKGDTMTPILRELEAIMSHPVKNHTILIDDVRQFGTSDFDFTTREEIISKLLQINPEYKIVYEDGYIKNDVMVAFIPKM